MIKYVIVNKSELDDPNSSIDFSQLSYSDSSKLRYSLDGSKAVIQYETPLPSFFSGMTTYTLSQIQEVLNGPEWTEVITEDDII
jgi:hypothetical protein